MNMIFKFVKSTDVRILILCLAAMLFLTYNASAQQSGCAMACKGLLNATLDPQTCSATLESDDLKSSDCPGDYFLEIINGGDVVASGTNHVTIYAPGEYIYRISNADGLPCWGTLLVEDKSAPQKKEDRRYDLDPNTEVCGQFMQDPSGYDDLKTELVSCVVEESGYSIEPWFDILEENDFVDCTAEVEVFNFTEVISFCELSEDFDFIFDGPEGWEPHLVYTRYWYAVDVQGNHSDTCQQNVITIRPSSSKIILEPYLLVDCSDVDGIVTGPSFIDVENGVDFLTCPQTSGKKVYMEPGLHCGYLIDVKCNDKIAICDASVDKVYKQTCSWTLVDWCSKYRPFNDFKQTVEVKDDTAPYVSQGEVRYDAGPYDCSATLIAGPASFDEEFECSNIVGWETIVEYGNVSYEGGFFERISVPTNGARVSDIPASAEIKIIWRATDGCGNVGEKEVMHSPRDKNAPVCIVNDEIIVGMITNDPVAHTVAARVYAEDIDDSSYDNCQEIELLIRRQDEKLALLADGLDPAILWAPYVDFSSQDLKGGACEATYKVELLVREDRVGGLFTECWGLVTIENKNAPTAKAPKDIYADCYDHLPGFGKVEIWGGCNSAYDEKTEIHIDDACAYDVIYHSTRTWKPYIIVDGAKHYGKSVSQSIIVKNVHDIKIAFPLDLEIDCNADGSIPDALTIDEILTNNGCGKWQMNVEDNYYSSVDDADCKKIIREYEFINWCTWEYNRTEEATVNRPDELILVDGQQVVLVYQDVQNNRINDIDDADDMDPYDQLVDEKGAKRDGAFVLIDNGDKPGDLPRFGGMDGINGRSVNYVDGYQYGRFVYRQIIKITDNTAPELTGGIDAIVCDAASTSCKLYTDVTASFSATDNCSNVELSYQLLVDGTNDPVNDPYGRFDGATISGRYPQGTHAFVVTASDGCNNITTKSYKFKVGKECKKPTPVGLATFTAVMENGNVEIWVSDVESGSSYDNCTDREDLVFGIELLTDQNGDNKITSVDVSDQMPIPKVLYLDCNDIGKVYVALWVRDLAGNVQYTIAPIYITDNNGDCDGIIAEMATVSGAITNESDEEIDQVMIKVNGAGVDAQASIFDGLFNFNVPMNENVSIAPEKNDNYLNGVSTSDLVLLQRHILGVTEINTAYSLIAADANNDQKVNTRDMLHFSRLILGVTDDLPNNSSWRFVDKNHQFINPTSPWGFAEVISLNDLSANEKADFIGIKIGDVSGNARPSDLLGTEAKVGQLEIAIDDQELVNDVETEITFRASDFNDIAGFQFTLKLNSEVEIIDVVPGVLPNLSLANFGMNRIEEGVITTSWANASGIQLADDEVLFTVVVKAAQAAKVSDILTINSEVTSAEAYDNELSVMDVKPLFIDGAAAELSLYQNTPNPFNGATSIGFDLPQAGAATLKIMDISGKSLSVITGEYNKGYNQIDLSAADINATGVLYYELTSSNASLTKKMVVIK